MARTSFLAALFVAITSVIAFSGQQSRSYAPPQQRQSALVQQRQVTPPRPATSPTPTAQRPAQTPTAAATSPATATPSLANSAFFLLPEDVKFPEASPGASRTRTLLGDPRAEGLYVTRTLIPKGAQTIPHTHPDSRTVTVLSGICYYGRGEVFDESQTIALPPGSFFTEPAGVPHFIWAKDGDVILQTTAIGPSGTQIVSGSTKTTGVEGGK